MNDVRFILRNLTRAPGFAVAAILTLAVAIGANTAMFSVLYAVVLQPLPFREPQRLVRVWATDTHNDSQREGASAPDFEDWKAQQRMFARVVGTTARMLNLTERNEEAERISATAVSHDYFTMLGVTPIAGRSFIEADDKPGAAPVAILSDTLWQRRFGGRRDVLGSRITLDGTSYEVVGIMPRTASLTRRQTEAWFPLSLAQVQFREIRGVHNVLVLARLKDGVDVQRAQGEMTVISERLAKQYPEDNVGRGAFIEPLIDSLVRDVRPRLFLLAGAVIAVLLIACINVAGLMLARADSRNRELAIRASLGASRGRIVRQLLTEAGAIGLLGGTVGVVFAWWGTKTIVALAPALPRADAIGVNVPVLLFALGIAILSVLLFGVVPAIRTSAVKPAGALAGSRGVLRATRTAGRGVLVIVEVAMAVVLVTGAGLLLKSFAKLMAVDVGLSTENVVTFSMRLPETTYPMPPRSEYPNWPKVTNFFDAALERVDGIQGVARSALAMNHPLAGGFTSRFGIAGRPRREGPQDEVRIRPVTSDYFGALGMTKLRGRGFTRDDRNGGPAVAVINDALAARYFPGENPVGRQIDFWNTQRTVVGVVKGERFGGPQQPAEPALYLPLAQLPMSDLTLVVRSHGDPGTVIAAVRGAMQSLDPDIALYDVDTLDAALVQTVATPRFQAVLIGSFGAIALLLAALGLYALIAYQVQQRTNEIGVRVALGATRRGIAGLILRRAAALTLSGIAIGLVGALLTGRFLKALLFEIGTTDPSVYLGVPMLLIVVALIASWVPARRAMRVDPAVALRYE